jgi:hypothetical protein
LLTTAAAVADYEGLPVIGVDEFRRAVTILRGELAMEGLGKPLSPLVRRAPAVVPDALQAVLQAWFSRLDHDVMATIGDDELAELLGDIERVCAS